MGDSIGLSLLMIFLNVAIFVVACALLFLAFPLRRLATGRWLLILVGSFCVISFFSLNVFSQNSFELKTLFSRFRFFGLSLLGPSWLLFLSSHYNCWPFLRRAWVAIVLFLPGLCTFALTLIPAFRDLVVTGFAPIEVSGMSVVSFRPGAWFPVHYIWTLILVGLSLAVGAHVFFRKKSSRSDDHRRQIAALMIGMIASVALDIYCVASETPLRWVMLSGGTFLITEAAIAFAALRYRLFALAVADMNNVYMNMPDPVLLVDAENRLRLYNKAAAFNFALSPQSVGQSCRKLLPGWTLDTRDLSLADASGRQRHYDFSARDIGQKDLLQGRILFFREVTAHKENEKRIRDSLEFKAKLMSLLTHDMSGHLNNQVLLTEFLSQASEMQIQEISEALAESAVASRNLVVGLLNWAKTQDGSFKPLMKSFEVNTLHAEVVEELEAQFKRRGVNLELTTHPQPILALGDSQMLGCVARNFLTNALNASSPGQKVRMKTELLNDIQRFRIVIADEGFGMSGSQVRSLQSDLDEFEVNTAVVKEVCGSSAKVKGYGIGFKLARKFIEMHHGELRIESQLGRGTVISYTISV